MRNTQCKSDIKQHTRRITDSNASRNPWVHRPVHPMVDERHLHLHGRQENAKENSEKLKHLCLARSPFNYQQDAVVTCKHNGISNLTCSQIALLPHFHDGNASNGGFATGWDIQVERHTEIETMAKTYANYAAIDAKRAPKFYGGAEQMFLSRHPEVILSGPYETGKTYPALYKFFALLARHPRSKGLMLRKTYTDLIDATLSMWDEDILPMHPDLPGSPIRKVGVHLHRNTISCRMARASDSAVLTKQTDCCPAHSILSMSAKPRN